MKKNILVLMVSLLASVSFAEEVVFAKAPEQPLIQTVPAQIQNNTAASKESVEALLSLINAEAMVDSTYSQLGGMMSNMTQQLGVDDEAAEATDRFMNKLMELMKEEISWEKMKEPLIEVYVNNYTEKEIQDMNAFYQSETGRSMLEKMPVVMQESMQISQKLVVGFLPKIEQLVEEMKLEAQQSKRN